MGIELADGLRQYLWAHRQGDLERARQLLRILPAVSTVQMLKYLIEDYWGRYLGWPDLLAWQGDEFLFVEVKLSPDKLSDQQRRWVEQNQARLHLPFKLAKIHRLPG